MSQNIIANQDFTQELTCEANAQGTTMEHNGKCTTKETLKELEELVELIKAKRQECEDLTAETAYMQEYAGSLMAAGIIRK